MTKPFFTTIISVLFAVQISVCLSANAATSEEIINAIENSDTEKIGGITKDDPALLQGKLIEIPGKEYQPTLLHLAAMEEKVDTLKFLLENGANPNAKDSNGNIPIIIAAEQKNNEAILYLVANGTDEKVLDSCIDLPSHLQQAQDKDEKIEKRAASFGIYKIRIKNAKENRNLADYVIKKVEEQKREDEQKKKDEQKKEDEQKKADKQKKEDEQKKKDDEAFLTGLTHPIDLTNPWIKPLLELKDNHDIENIQINELSVEVQKHI
ncbi:MAG: ankyrin repeat domain-containing protein [Planctomycetaceae bacterium]|jgi:ankyrin repeat protein|nr:ankyrin repeat domain-containing protein [Planctomycetaceae bacterium]